MESIRDRLKPDTMLKISFDSNEAGDTNSALNTSDEAPRFIIGYWSIRGLGAPIRAMLSAAQVDHQVALYDLTEAPGDSAWEMKAYAADKQWLRDEYDCFMNLPFLVDTKRDLVLAQTNAIFQYLGRELKMEGKDAVEQAKIDEMLCEIMDLRDNMVAFVYRSSGTKEEAQAMLKRANANLGKFESHLAKNYPDYFKTLEPQSGKEPMTGAQAKGGIAHLIPGSFTAPDFHLWEMLDQYEGMCRTFGFPLWAEGGDEQNTSIDFQSRPDVKPEERLYPHLEEFKNTFVLLPENSHYIGSYLHKEIPCNNCMGKFASCFKDFRQYTRGQDAPWRKKGEVGVQYKKVVD